MARRPQPLDQVNWVDPATLEPNTYNPNSVAPPELQLLKDSILADGWTQPIVVTSGKEIVDGFHRWTLGLRDEEVRALTNGTVPTVETQRAEEQERMASTIRHNRARGAHGVVLMAQIVRHMKDELGLTDQQVSRNLGMELEEVDRLYDRAGMSTRGSRKAEAFSKGWVPGKATS
jgi:ParB-like chromosome segregation protein Spo0J